MMPTIQDTLLTRAISGVLTGAQEGQLPLFAWTLGMPQHELLRMVQRCFPELGELVPGNEADYERILKTVPQDFHEIVAMLLAEPLLDEQPERAWLARAVAAASFGEQHLWEELGLFDRDDVSTLFAQYFPAFAQRNTRGMRWKRFLFHELSLRLNRADAMPPGCAQCEEFDRCAPSQAPIFERPEHHDELCSPH